MEEVRQNKVIVWFGIPNGTDFWQPVDAGPGKVFKSRIKQEQNIWLELDENIEIWLGNDERKLSAKDRRILITGWVGSAYRKASKDEKFQSMLYRSFEKIGCLITADGSKDEKIQPEGMPGYIVPPLSMFQMTMTTSKHRYRRKFEKIQMTFFQSQMLKKSVKRQMKMNTTEIFLLFFLNNECSCIKYCF